MVRVRFVRELFKSAYLFARDAIQEMLSFPSSSFTDKEKHHLACVAKDCTGASQQLFNSMYAFDAYFRLL